MFKIKVKPKRIGIKFWAYVHSESGAIKVKSYFGKEDLDDAHQSPFCKFVFSPIDAPNVDIAYERFTKKWQEIQQNQKENF